MRTVTSLAWSVVCCALVLLAGCPAAQVKPTGPTGEVNVVLRRIDVVKAGFDSMDVKVIVAVENATDTDLDVTGDATIGLVGKAEDSEAGDDSAEGDDEGTEETNDDEVAGEKTSGSGHGTAPAGATSELPIFVTLKLPSDQGTLEEVLGWTKGRVHVAGKVKFGFSEQTIGGEREVALPKLPNIQLKNPQVAKVDDGAAGEAFLTILLENTNPFEVDVDTLTWRILIADKELKTRDDGGTSIPPSSIEEYNVSIVLDESAFPKDELKKLLKQPSISYRVDAAFDVKGMKKSEMFSGEMQFPR